MRRHHLVTGPDERGFERRLTRAARIALVERLGVTTATAFRHGALRLYRAAICDSCSGQTYHPVWDERLPVARVSEWGPRVLVVGALLGSVAGALLSLGSSMWWWANVVIAIVWSLLGGLLGGALAFGLLDALRRVPRSVPKSRVRCADCDGALYSITLAARLRLRCPRCGSRDFSVRWGRAPTDGSSGTGRMR